MWDSLSTYLREPTGLDGIQYSQNFGTVRQQINQAARLSPDQDYCNATSLQVLLVLKAAIQSQENLKA